MARSVKQTRQLLRRLHNSNEQTPLHRVEKNIVQLIHEPSAGGTTVGQVVLWEIREEYPAIVLLNLDVNYYKDVLDWLSHLFTICQLPLCILIDTSVMTDVCLKDVEKFATEIQEAEVQAVIFFVQQLADVKPNYGQLILQNRLTDDEKLRFDDLMSLAGQLLRKTPSKTVTLYGLCQFGTKYKLLEEKLIAVQHKGNKEDKTLLLLSSITYSYLKQPLPFYFVAKIFKSGPEQFYAELEERLDALHMARDFLIVQEDGKMSDNFQNGIRPVTSFVSNKILEFVFGPEPASYLQQFIFDLLDLVDHTSICDQAITAVIKPLFMQRIITDGTKEMFSPFVNDTEKAYGIDQTLIILTKLANSLAHIHEESPHMRSRLARYLAYRKGDIDEALIEMHKALNITARVPFYTTNSTDSKLLTIAGNLINLKISQLANRLPNSRESFTSVLEEVAELFNDARLVLHRAQKYETNSHPFISEARLLYNYMYFYFCGQCQKKPADFSKLLACTTDDVLKEAAEEALKKLSLLECLLQKHDMDGFDEKTEEEISKIKIKILKLKIDIQGTNQNVFEKMCKTDPGLARNVVEFYFYNIERRMETLPEKDQKRPSFELLAPQALTAIIELFSEHSSSGLTRSNYRHAILAMIYIYKQCPRLQCGNLLMAQNFAEMWSKNYQDDNRPYFFLSLINLIKALSVDAQLPYSARQRRDFMKKMKEYYKKCRELLNKRDHFKKLNVYKHHPHEITFVFGDYDNLRALIPKDSKYEIDIVCQENKLRIFTGKARSVEEGNILWCDELQSNVTIPYDIYRYWKKYAKERRQYWFYLQTRTSGFFVERLFDHNPLSRS